MKSLTTFLLALLILLQYPLWLGKGGWIKAWDLNRQIEQQVRTNQQTQARNTLLDADVRDLKQGTEALEERARLDMGMIKPNEIFYQVIEPAPVVSNVSAVSAVGIRK